MMRYGTLWTLLLAVAIGCGRADQEADVGADAGLVGTTDAVEHMEVVFQDSVQDSDQGEDQDAPQVPETIDSISEPMEVGDPAQCPLPVIVMAEGDEVPPQTLVHLSGEHSQAASGNIQVYSWTLTQPPENKFHLVPTYSFPNPTHEVNVAGTYEYCLDVCDAGLCSDHPACATTVCRKIVVVPCQAIHCELTWDTPADPDQWNWGPDAGADMDLHFARPLVGGGDPWFDLTYDCFWYNPNPGWESMDPNVSDDPGLDRDDTDGSGPENINLDQPKAGTVYRIGVHYWDDHGFGLSYPRVKCWIYGQLRLDSNLAESSTPMQKCDLWEVATIQWPSEEITPVLMPGGELKITPCYPIPDFGQLGDDYCSCDVI